MIYTPTRLDPDQLQSQIATYAPAIQQLKEHYQQISDDALLHSYSVDDLDKVG